MTSLAGAYHPGLKFHGADKVRPLRGRRGRLQSHQARAWQGCTPSEKNGEFWDHTKHEFAVYVTDLPKEYSLADIQQLYRNRANVENVFDELKNQWGFGGFRETLI